MIEILGYIALIYFVCAFTTFVVLNVINGKPDTFGLSYAINAGISLFWIIMVPMMIYTHFDSKRQK